MRMQGEKQEKGRRMRMQGEKKEKGRGGGREGLGEGKVVGGEERDDGGWRGEERREGG